MSKPEGHPPYFTKNSIRERAKEAAVEFAADIAHDHFTRRKFLYGVGLVCMETYFGSQIVQEAIELNRTDKALDKQNHLSSQQKDNNSPKQAELISNLRKTKENDEVLIVGNTLGAYVAAMGTSIVYVWHSLLRD